MSSPVFRTRGPFWSAILTLIRFRFAGPFTLRVFVLTPKAPRISHLTHHLLPFHPLDTLLHMADQKYIHGAEVAKHNSRESCWIIVHGEQVPVRCRFCGNQTFPPLGNVYDVTEFLDGVYHTVKALYIKKLKFGTLQNTLV